MKSSSILPFLVFSSLIATPISAATLTATNATFKKVFYAAKAGDTIRLVGTFGRTAMMNRSYSNTVTIDARGATFTDTLSFKNVNNVTLIGGRYGTMSKTAPARIRVEDSSRVTIRNPVITNNHGGHGVDVGRSSLITVDGGIFTAVGLGVGFTSVTNSKIINSKSINSSSDGFNVADSHKVLVSHNSCTGTAINSGSSSHPDCVQLWSIKGNPVQSDIEISDNSASGATQGFTSFNAFAGGGLRIKILRNRVDTTYPQGVACYSCIDSQIIGNVITTQAGAQWRTMMNIVGGRNNIVSGNKIGSFAKLSAKVLNGVAPAAADPWSDLVLADLEKARFVSDRLTLGPPAWADVNGLRSGVATSTAVPEPAAWMMLIVGFGAAGAVARRRRLRAITC